MQSQAQVPFRNYIYFFISFAVLTFGWTWLKTKIWPVQKPNWPFAGQPAERQAKLLTGLASAVALAPTDIFPQAGLGSLGLLPTAPPKPFWPYEHSPRSEQEAALRRMIGSAAPAGGLTDALRIAAACRIDDRAIALYAEAAQPVEEFVLGGAGFPITATMTSMGAGVRELVLNDPRFRAADKYGLPAVDKNGQPKQETLLPRHDGEPPAFAIYHYAKPDDSETNPVDTLGRIRWTVVAKDLPRSISFAAEVQEFGVRIIKTFTLNPAEYHLGLAIRVERTGPGNGAKFRYQLAGGRGLPIEGEWYATTFRNVFVGLKSPSGSLFRLSADSGTMSRHGGTQRYFREDKHLIYAAVAVQYFASVIAVDDLGADGQPLPADKMGFLEFVRGTVEEHAPDRKRSQFDDITVRAITEPIDPQAGNPVEHRYLLYHGPLKVQQLSRLKDASAVPSELVKRYADDLQLKTLTDYGNFGFWSTLIIWFTNVIHGLVGILTKFLPNGVAIMVVTICVRGMMFPISKRQAANMQRMQTKMQKLSPEMKEIDKKYKDDFLMKQQSQRELYRKHNVNPAAGLGGCLMLFLQMPIFMGLYYALQESVFFRLDRFLWMPNLAAPDMLFWWGEKVKFLTEPEYQGNIYYLGPYFNLLPVVAAVLIFVQQKMSMPKEMTDEQRQQYGIMKYMTIFMALMFYRVPSGLSLYFICSSLWGLTERRLVKRMVAAEKEIQKNNPGPGGKGSGRGAGKGGSRDIEKPPGKFRLWWENILKEASKK